MILVRKESLLHLHLLKRSQSLLHQLQPLSLLSKRPNRLQPLLLRHQHLDNQLVLLELHLLQSKHPLQLHQPLQSQLILIKLKLMQTPKRLPMLQLLPKRLLMLKKLD